MIVSVNPTYLCNLRCKYCYLNESQLSDKKVLNIDDLIHKLNELNKIEKLELIDLYGGEPSLLEPSYVYKLLDNINCDFIVTSNGTKIPEWFYDDRVKVTISFDFNVRKMSDKVLNNIINFNKNISLNILVTPELLKRDVLADINFINKISNIDHVSLKFFSPTHKNNDDYMLEYNKYLEIWYKHSNKLNIDRLDSNEKHIFITPNNKYAIVKYTSDNREYFKEFNYDQLLNELDEEFNNHKKTCSDCKYYNNCLSEHHHPYNSQKWCNGGRLFIERCLEN